MFLEGFGAVFGNPITILWILFGVAVGIVFGAIPGLTATMAVVMFLPLTYTMEPTMGIALLIALYIGGTSGALYLPSCSTYQVLRLQWPHASMDGL